MDSKGLLAYISAMLIYGTLSLVVRNIDLSVGEMAFWRVIIALVLLLLYKRVTHGKLPFKKLGRDFLPLALSGIAISADWVLFFEAFKYTSVSVATLCYYFCPVLLMVLSPVIFKEKLTLRKCLFFTLATFGLVLIVGGRPQGGSRELLGITLGLISALVYAFIIILNKSVKTVDGIDRTLIQFCFALLALAVYVPLTSGFHVGELKLKGLSCLVILGAVHTALAYGLYFSAVPKMKAQQVALLGYIDPLVAVIVSATFLQEKITTFQLIGGGMIIGFTILNELTEAKSFKAAGCAKAALSDTAAQSAVFQREDDAPPVA